MGFIRFFLLVTLIQFMASLPIKMVLRWTMNLKYIVFIPEAFFEHLTGRSGIGGRTRLYKDFVMID